MDIASAMRAARLAAGVSLAQMSELTNFSKPYLGQLETGKRDIRPEHVAAYENALGTPLRCTTDQVTMTDVELVSDVTNSLARLGLRHGGVAIAEAAKAHWTWTEQLLKRSMTDNVRNALHSQASQLADRFAWSLGDVGRADRAVQFHQEALKLASQDNHVLGVVKVSYAGYLIDRGHPAVGLELLDGITEPTAVVAFTAHAARAEAYAQLGSWQDTIRAVSEADEAHANVDMSSLPETHAPYASGHAAHAHRSAGTALHILAKTGDKRAIPVALDRLTTAITHFGPDRARTIAKCHALISDLTRGPAGGGGVSIAPRDSRPVA